MVKSLSLAVGLAVRVPPKLNYSSAKARGLSSAMYSTTNFVDAAAFGWAVFAEGVAVVVEGEVVDVFDGRLAIVAGDNRTPYFDVAEGVPGVDG
jgi:hypothetical protein